MRIIHQGNLEEQEQQLFRGKCPYCSAIVEYERRELPRHEVRRELSIMPKQLDYAIKQCPVCGDEGLCIQYPSAYDALGHFIATPTSDR